MDLLLVSVATVFDHRRVSLRVNHFSYADYAARLLIMDLAICSVKKSPELFTNNCKATAPAAYSERNDVHLVGSTPIQVQGKNDFVESTGYHWDAPCWHRRAFEGASNGGPAIAVSIFPCRVEVQRPPAAARWIVGLDMYCQALQDCTAQLPRRRPSLPFPPRCPSPQTQN